MKFIYPAIIYKEDDGYWEEFSDLEGAVSDVDTFLEVADNLEGAVSDVDTFLEVADNLEGALNGYISSILDRQLTLNKATSDISKIEREKNSEIVFIKIDVDLNKANKSVKKTLTIPYWLEEKAKSEGINFSQTLQEALIKKMNY